MLRRTRRVFLKCSPLRVQIFLPIVVSKLALVHSQGRMTPLMLACRLGRQSMVDMLVDVFGAELDYADKVKHKTKSPQKHASTFRGNNISRASTLRRRVT